MSPKASHSPDHDDEDHGEETALPSGYVPMPRRSERHGQVSWWWKGSALIVLMAAAIVSIWFVVKDPDPRESARGTAGLVAESITDADMAEFESSLCDRGKTSLPESFKQVGKTSVLAVSTEHDGVASATLTPDRRRGVDLVLLMDKRDEEWCVVVVTACPRAEDLLPSAPVPDARGCRPRPGR